MFEVRLRLFLFIASLIFALVFIVFSYSVAKEVWQQLDFDTTVKLQDRIPRRFDDYFSYFSVLGSAEVTVSIIAIFIFLNFLKFKIIPIIGWLIIIPATVIEVAGKLFLFHPGPPVLFHRTITQTHLPSFYIHTNFSYPSGHMLRTTFIVTALTTLIIFSNKGIMFKSITISLLGCFLVGMLVTRVYLGEHWLSDVLGGMILGVSAGFFTASLNIQKSKLTHLQER